MHKKWRKVPVEQCTKVSAKEQKVTDLLSLKLWNMGYYSRRRTLETLYNIKLLLSVEMLNACHSSRCSLPSKLYSGTC